MATEGQDHIAEDGVPVLTDLISTADAAEILQVTRQYVHHLVRNHVRNIRPGLVGYHLGSSKGNLVLYREAVEDFAANRPPSRFRRQS